MLIHFHVIVSITASVFLVEIMYPEQRHKSWIKNKTLMGCFIALVLWIPTGFWMTSYVPPLLLYALVWIAVFALGWAAYRILYCHHALFLPLDPVGFGFFEQ